jgi:stearoyl-CoA desaturase (delta-9 desaturase)
MIPTAIGALHYGSIIGAVRGLVWGGAARVVLVNNIIWSINSLCHLTGAQRYRTNDQSRNNWWLALPSLGEAWHNNHHVCPSSSAFGHKWWELDIGFWVIKGLHLCKLVREVRVVPPRTVAKFKT